MICLHYSMWETSQSMPTSTEGLVGRQSIWRFGCCVTYMWWVREDILPLTLGARQKLQQQTWYLHCQGHGHWNWALQLFILWCGATRLQLTFWCICWYLFYYSLWTISGYTKLHVIQYPKDKERWANMWQTTNNSRSIRPILDHWLQVIHIPRLK